MFPRIMTTVATIRPGKLWSLPNILTYGRVLAVPLVVGFLLRPEVHWMRWTAFWLFAAAGVTDFFDGYLARIWQQQSTLGKMLDPIADKLLISASLLVLAACGTFGPWSIWAAMIILCREILVSGLREFLAELRVSVPVSWIAKWKTTAQILALGFLIVGPAGDGVLPPGQTMMTGLALLWVAALLTLYTGIDYMMVSFKHVSED